MKTNVKVEKNVIKASIQNNGFKIIKEKPINVEAMANSQKMVMGYRTHTPKQCTHT